jgi:nucleoside-diphosphate-sugar epimerase
MLAEHYAHNYGLTTRVLRFSNSYTSVHDRLNRVVPKFILQALRGEPITVHGGNQIFDFVYLDDTVSGIIACLREVHQSSIPYNDFNLTTGKKTSIKNLVKHMLTLTRSNSSLTLHPARQYDVAHFWGSPAKAKKILGWAPHYTIVDGLKKAIAELRTL